MALSTSDLAKQLDTAPKTLCQFLRSRDAGVGSGARYTFTEDQVDALRAEFEAWANKKSTRRSTRRSGVDMDAPGLDLRTATREDVKRLSAERVDRLEQLLKSRGMHLSQMREHHTWDRHDVTV